MPDIFATGDVDLKKLLNAEDHRLISRIKSILGPFILRRLKSDVMQQLVPKIHHVRESLLRHRQSVVLLDVSTYVHLSLQVKFVIMDTEQSKAYKNSIDEYRSACQARGTKSSVDITNNVVGLIPKRQISNYFTQFRKVRVSYDAKFYKYIYGCFRFSFIAAQIANHPLLVRRFYSDKDVDRIARLLYPKGAFGFECTLERAIQELKNYNDFDIHQVLFFLDFYFMSFSIIYCLAD